MDKSSKIKTFNILVWVLVPLFLIVVCTGFIVAGNGMSSNKEANNSIAIGSLGSVTTTINLSATNSNVFPGATNQSLPISFSYQGGNGVTKLNLTNFRVSNLRAKIPNDPTSYGFTSDVITFSPIADVSNWVVSSSKAHTLTFSVKKGYSGNSEDGVPNLTTVNSVPTLNYLINPITEISFTLTFDVTDAGV